MAEGGFGGKQVHIVASGHWFGAGFLGRVPDQSLDGPCALARVGFAQFIGWRAIYARIVVLLDNFQPYRIGPGLGRELEEEWSVVPDRLCVEALVRLSNGMVMLIGQAWLSPGTSVTPDEEHDTYAWWPAEVERWPAEADAPLRLMASMLAGS